MFWRLLIASLVMLIGGYLGEALVISKNLSVYNWNGSMDIHSI